MQIVQDDFIRSARSVRSAGSALGGTLGRTAAIVTTTLAAMVAADAGRVAAAQGRFEAEYSATLAGISIGRGNWVIEISDDQFTATASGGTFGIVRVLTHGHGVSTAQGPLNGGQPVPQSYVSTITNDKRIDDFIDALRLNATQEPQAGCSGGITDATPTPLDMAPLPS